MEMTTFLPIVFYLIYGMSLAYLMNEIADTGVMLWIVAVIFWPFMLPIAAMLSFLDDIDLNEL